MEGMGMSREGEADGDSILMGLGLKAAETADATSPADCFRATIQGLGVQGVRGVLAQRGRRPSRSGLLTGVV